MSAIVTLACSMASLAMVVPASSADGVSDTTGALCTPTSQTLGDSSGSATIDTGVATYVGNNMYIGDPSSTWTSANPTGSYAAEAEGLTVVKNNFYANLLKGFFTMGTVAFGANYRPEENTRTPSTVLSVGGTAQTWNGVQTQGVGISGNGGYQGQIGNGLTRVWGNSTATTTKSASVYRYGYKTSSGTSVSDGSVIWKSGAAKNLIVTGTNNGTGYSTDYSTYGTTISTLSSQLDALSTTGTTTLGTAPPPDTADSTYAKYKYDGTVKAWFRIAAGAEKLITFAGNDSSKLQVFQVKASDLTSSGYNGLDFAFTGIPVGASVVVNVVNDAGAPYTGTVDFQQGWRFWWNDTEISNGYVEKDASNVYGATGVVTDEMRSAYTAASQSIMWNYSGATSVYIKGSQATGISGNIYKAKSTDLGWSQFTNATVTDDPSSAVLGSILVPGRNLTTHVTTNGRVWVGGNYAMLNTINVTQGSLDIFFGTNKSASIVDMDQERHNFPWSAQTSSECSSITWNKVDAATVSDTRPTTLAGSEWAVYGSYPGSSSTPLLTVTDTTNDWNSATGEFTVQGLKPNAGYYLKETVAPKGYQLSDTIYYVMTSGTGSTTNPVTHKVTSVDNGTPQIESINASDSADSNIPDAKTAVSWSKVDAADTGSRLSGSVWKIVGPSGDSSKTYCVTDGGSEGDSPSDVPTECDDAIWLGDSDSSDDGSLTVKGLQQGTYTLTEVAAPSGYVKSTASYSFEITDSSGDVAIKTGSDPSTGTDVTYNKITNSKTAVSWSKVDAADTGSLLSGSVWKIVGPSGDSSKTYCVADDGAAGVIPTDVPSGCSSTDTTAWLGDTKTTDGNIGVEGLPTGAYELTEVQAPENYVKSDTVYSFEITDSSGDVAIKTGSDPSTGTEVTYNKITNAKAITALPKTGAWWTGRKMEIIGVVLVAFAGLGYGATTLIRRRDGGQGSARP